LNFLQTFISIRTKKLSNYHDDEPKFLKHIQMLQ
jgi:hypothetical protein